MIEVMITQQMRDWAKKEMKPGDNRTERPLHKYGSEPHRILEGYIGQSMVMKHWGITKAAQTFDYDLVHEGLKYEVKTISCENRPPPDFLATINSSDENSHRQQDCDRVVFTRIQFKHQFGWICGWIDKEKFWRIAVRVKKGDEYHGIRFDKAPAAVVFINQLNEMNDLSRIGSCNTCKHYIWVKLTKWCRATESPIGPRWMDGCEKYLDAYAKTHIVTDGKRYPMGVET